jgi:hypothetical protein
MQSLRRTEHGAAERMSDHNVVADFNGEQGKPPLVTLRMILSENRFPLFGIMRDSQ